MRYVYVKDGKVIDDPVLLPKNWENISNFNALDNESLKQFGWYPHRFVPSIVDETVVVIGSNFVVEDDEVVEYQTTRPKTESEIQDDINQRWINVRSQRAIYLQESDWTQLADVPLSSQKKLEWSSYRQALRDITNYDSPYHVVWPEKPSSDDIFDGQLISEELPIDTGVINE